MLQISHNPLKTITIKGKIDYKFKNNQLFAEQRVSLDYAELLRGSWEICVSDISYIISSSKLRQCYYLNLSSSNVLSSCYSNQQLTTKSTNLVNFLLKDNCKGDIIYVPAQNWFFLNNLSGNDIQFFLSCENYKELLAENVRIQLYFTILFRKFN